MCRTNDRKWFCSDIVAEKDFLESSGTEVLLKFGGSALRTFKESSAILLKVMRCKGMKVGLVVLIT